MVFRTLSSRTAWSPTRTRSTVARLRRSLACSAEQSDGSDVVIRQGKDGTGVCVNGSIAIPNIVDLSSQP